MDDEEEAPERQEFTHVEIEEFNQAFNLFDRDDDGLINYKEFSTIMRAFGQQYEDLDLSDMFTEADEADSGLINFDQFVKILEQYYKEDFSEEDLLKAFKAFDKEGAGFIERMDLKDIMLHYGDKMNEDDFTDFMGTADVNGDGIIKYEWLTNTIFTFLIE